MAANRPVVVEQQWHRGQLQDLIAGRPIRDVEDAESVPEEEWQTLKVRTAKPVENSAAFAVAGRLMGPRPSMKAFNITESFMVYFKISLVCGFVFASPWIFYQIWAFVAAGLYPHEKYYVNY